MCVCVWSVCVCVVSVCVCGQCVCVCAEGNVCMQVVCVKETGVYALYTTMLDKSFNPESISLFSCQNNGSRGS